MDEAARRISLAAQGFETSAQQFRWAAESIATSAQKMIEAAERIEFAVDRLTGSITDAKTPEAATSSNPPGACT